MQERCLSWSPIPTPALPTAAQHPPPGWGRLKENTGISSLHDSGTGDTPVPRPSSRPALVPPGAQLGQELGEAVFHPYCFPIAKELWCKVALDLG